MKKILLICLVLVLGVFVQSYAQERVVKGTVTSYEDGSTLPGVSVVVKGTTIGTVTDIDGKYKISVPENATLIFSFIGMTTEDVVVGNQSVIDVQLMPSIEALTEVVVTAIGIKRETKALGYSVQEIKADQLAKANNANVLNAMTGKVAGVQITSSSGAAGASSYMTIRGAASITGNNQPLFVVDGVPIDNSQYYSGNPDAGTNNLTEGVAYSNRAIDLNPDDIESISVLKGGAATALYGLRAANGVVIITTKKGATAKDKKMAVSFNTSFSFDKVNKLPELQNKYAQGVNGQWRSPSTRNRNSWGPLMDTCVWTNDPTLMVWGGPNDLDSNGVFDWDKNGIIVGKSLFPSGKPVTPYDNVGKFFQTGMTQNHSLSLSGGTEDANYYFSMSHMKTKGVIPNNAWAKTTFKIAGDSKLGEKFKAAGSVNFINSGGDRIQQGSNLSGLMLGLLRTPPSFDNSNGFDDPVNEPAAYMFTDPKHPKFGSQRSYRGYGVYDNPYFTVNKNKFTDDVNRIIGMASVSYEPVDWISITYRLGNDLYSDRRNSYFAVGSSQFTAGQLSEDHHFNTSFNADLFATIKKEIVKDVQLNAVVGHNMFQNYHQQLYVEGNGLIQPDYYHLSNASSVMSRENQSKKRTSAVYSDFGFSYKSLAFVNITGRNEWSTTLPEEHNSFFFPSFSGAFVFTELPALNENKILSFGKIRASYAIIANDAFEYRTVDYFSQAAYGDGWTSGISFPFGGLTGYVVDDNIGNKDLKPEKMKSFEVGADIRFLNNRFGIDLAYYNNQNQDLILDVPIAGSTGFPSMTMNAGTMENKGIEAVLSLTPVKMKQFEWNMQINYTKSTNTVLSLAEGIESVGLGGFTGAEIRAVAGKPYGSVYGVQYVKDENGNIVYNDSPGSTDPNAPDYNPDRGLPMISDKEGELGSIQPKWIGGLTNTFTIMKDINISFLFDTRKGAIMWNGTKGALYTMGTHKDTEDRGTKVVFEGVKGHYDADGNLVITGTNDIEVVKSQYYYTGVGGGFAVTEPFIEKADWVRLRDVTISYSLNKNIVKKTFFKGVEVYASGKNLWLSTSYTGVDPETSLYGASNAQGIDYFNMPNTKSYTFGLRLNL